MTKNSLTNEDIDKYINDLVAFLGIKESAPTSQIKQLLSSGKTKEGIKAIAHYLGLPIDIDITYDDNFRTTALIKTDAEGNGTESITAQVDIPSSLPTYGSSRLNDFPVHIRISKNYNKNPKTTICLIAHELSHVLLYSLNHKYKHNEFCTDLTAMILGFNVAMLSGRKAEETTTSQYGTYTSTTTYGYFDDTQFDYAYKRIRSLLWDRIKLRETLQDKTEHIKKNILLFKNDINLFINGLEELDKKAPKKINQKDANSLVGFHSMDYLKKYSNNLTNIESKIQQIGGGNKFAHYTQNLVSLINSNISEIDSLSLSLSNSHNMLKADIKIVYRYLKLSKRVKRFLSTLFRR